MCLLAIPGLRGCAVHPAMAHIDDAGQPADTTRRALAGEPVRIVGWPEIRWPLVHACGLAKLYRAVLEDGSFSIHVISSTEEGIRVGDPAACALAAADREVGPSILSEDAIAT